MIAITRTNSLEDDPKAGIDLDVNTAGAGKTTVVLLIVRGMKFGHGLEMKKLNAADTSMSRRIIGGMIATTIANRAAGIAARAKGLKESSAASAENKAATRVRINGSEVVVLIVDRNHGAITEVKSGVTVQMRRTEAVRIRTIFTIRGRIREVHIGANRN